MKDPGAQARPVGSVLKWSVPGARELVEGAVPTQLSDCCQGCCSRYSRSILGALWAPTEDRVAGGAMGSSRQPSGYCPDDRRTEAGPGGSAYRRLSCLKSRCPTWRQDRCLQGKLPPGFQRVPNSSASCASLEIHPEACLWPSQAAVGPGEL